MRVDVFLDRIVDDGIRAARREYAARPDELRGAVGGFAACRRSTPAEIAELLASARRIAREASAQGQVASFWEARFRAIFWVADCLSAAIEGAPAPPIVPPTARGYVKAAEVLSGLLSRPSRRLARASQEATVT